MTGPGTAEARPSGSIVPLGNPGPAISAAPASITITHSSEAAATRCLKKNRSIARVTTGKVLKSSTADPGVEPVQALEIAQRQRPEGDADEGDTPSALLRLGANRQPGEADADKDDV
jgi:hypothetical protein